MPIDATASVSGDVHRVLDRRALRLGVGVTAIFLVAAYFQWTFAYLAPIFLPLLLQGPRPMRTAEAIGLLVALLAVMIGTYVLSAMSRQMPLLFALLLLPLMFAAFRWWFRGAPAMIFLMVLLGLVLTPLTAKASLDAAWDISMSFVWNIGICVIMSYVLFVLFPPLPGEPEAKPATVLPVSEASWRAAALAVMVGGFTIAYLAFDWHNVHTPVYIAIYAMTLRSLRTAGIALGILAANVVGGLTGTVMYELTAMVPSFAFLAVLTLPVMVTIARAVVSEASWAPLASFAMSVVLLILGAAIGPHDPDSGAEDMAYRLFELGIAAIYAVAATFVLEAFRPPLRESSPSMRTASTTASRHP